MQESNSVAAACDRAETQTQRPSRQSWRRIAVLFALCAMIFAAGFVGHHVTPLRAGNDSDISLRAAKADSSDARDRAAASSRKLRELHAETARLANQLLANLGEYDRLVRAAADCEVALAELRKACELARSERERAEIAVTEYEQGAARKDEAKFNGEVFEARQQLEAARHKIESLTDERSKIKETAGDGIHRLAASILMRDRIRVAEHQENVAAAALADAESRRIELLEHTKPARVKDLRSAVEKLKESEHSLKSRRDHESSKLQELRMAALERTPLPGEQRVLALLDQAIALEERARANIELCTSAGAVDPESQKNIDELTSQVEAIVDQAMIAGAAAENARLKPRIKAAAVRHAAATKRGPRSRGERARGTIDDQDPRPSG
jgi:hypothetical protein